MYYLRLLGDPRLTDEGGETLSPWNPELALLALLARSPEGARRETAATLLWPESAEDRARAALRQALFRLRRRVGELIRSEGDVLTLDDARVRVDVREVEAALVRGDPEAALQRYGGPFLHGFVLDGSVLFEQWADGQRATLHARVEEALAQLIAEAEEAGDWPRALEWARRWSTLSPLNEAAVLRSMRLHALAGDPTRALETHREFGQRLRREMDWEPSAELNALAERIRAGRGPQGDEGPPSQPRTGAADPTSPERTPHEAASWPMVGRGTEFRRLRTLWKEAREGRRRFVLVTGEPGIGKSRLAWELAERVRLEGATVLEGRAYEVERSVPYTALTGILRSALDAPGLSGMDTPALAELSRIVPSFLHRFPAEVDRPLLDLAAGRLRLMDAVRSLLDNLSYEAPVLLLLDDLPWADDASVAALHFAWRSLPEHPLLILATARTEDLDPDGAAHRMWTSLLKETSDAVDQVALDPLPPKAIGRLAEPERDVQALERKTGGNPLFLVELLRMEGEEGEEDQALESATSSRIRLLVEERIRRLDEAQRRLLQAAAVLGRRFPLPTAAAVARLHPRVGARAVAGLSHRGLVRTTGVGYDFVHDVVRQIVREGLPPEERRLLHIAAFQRMAPDEPSHPEPGREPRPGLARAAALARHAEEGGLMEQAFSWSLHAAARAEELHAAEAAADHLSQARRLARTPDEERAAWVRTGELESARARFPLAALAFLEAIRRAEPGTSERLRLRLRLTECSLRGGLMEASELTPELAPLLEEAGTGSDPPLLRDAHAVAALVHRESGDVPRALEHARRSVVAGREAGEAAPLVRTLLLLAQVSLGAGREGEVLAALQEGERVALEAGLDRELYDVISDLGTELSRLGRWDEALRIWRSGLERAVESQDFGAEAIFRLNTSDLLARRGEKAAATGHLDRLEELCRRFHFPHVESAVPLNRGLAAWFSGEVAQARGYADQALDRLARGVELPPGVRRTRERIARSLVLLTLLEADHSREDLAAPLEALEEAESADHGTWSDDREVVALAISRAKEAMGDLAGARAVLEQARSQMVEPFGRGLLFREEGRLRAPHDPGRATRLAAEADDLLEPLGLRWWPGG